MVREGSPGEDVKLRNYYLCNVVHKNMPLYFSLIVKNKMVRLTYCLRPF